jgi:hypothetical protein
MAGQVPSGPWALLAGGDVDLLVVRLVLPADVAWTAQGAPAALTQSWKVSSVDGRHLVWGVTPAEVATIVVTLSDGRAVEVPTQPVQATGVDRRAFAVSLPAGALLTAVEARVAGGSALLRADDVAASLEPALGFDPAVTVDLPVVVAAAG